MLNTFTASDACKLIENGAQLVDVRSAAEFANGALPDAINLPLQSIVAADNLLDKNRAIVLYCLSGARSSMAKNHLLQMGFGEVHDLGSFKNYDC